MRRATTAAADLAGHVVDQFPGFQTLGFGLGDAGHQCDFLTCHGRQDNRRRTQFVFQLVRGVTQTLGVGTFQPGRQHLDTLDLLRLAGEVAALAAGQSGFQGFKLFFQLAITFQQLADLGDGIFAPALDQVGHFAEILFGFAYVLAHDGTQIDAPVVVNAAGPFAGRVAAMLGDELPIRNVFQQKIMFDDKLGSVPRDLPFAIDLDPVTLDWPADVRDLLPDCLAGRRVIGVLCLTHLVLGANQLQRQANRRVHTTRYAVVQGVFALGTQCLRGRTRARAHQHGTAQQRQPAPHPASLRRRRTQLSGKLGAGRPATCISGCNCA